MDTGLIWIVGGLALLGAELLAPGVFLLWVGLAAVGTGLLLLVAAPGFGVTVAVFLGLLAGGVAVGLRLRRRPHGGAMLNTPGAGLVGRRAVVLAVDGPALRVRVGDSDWAARVLPGGAALGVGAAAEVVAVDGTLLLVRPA